MKQGGLDDTKPITAPSYTVTLLHLRAETLFSNHSNLAFAHTSVTLFGWDVEPS